MYSVQFSEISLTEYRQAIEYYQAASKGLAKRFETEFWSKVELIKQNPLIHQVRYRNIRIGHLSVFPYGIHFIMENDVIYVLRILHHKQFYA